MDNGGSRDSSLELVPTTTRAVVHHYTGGRFAVAPYANVNSQREDEFNKEIKRNRNILKNILLNWPFCPFKKMNIHKI